MTGLAPEPADRAIARVLAGGLTDTPTSIAAALTEVLNRAVASGTCVIPYIDIGDGHFEVLYSIEGGPRTTPCWGIEYDTATGQWHATEGDPPPN